MSNSISCSAPSQKVTSNSCSLVSSSQGSRLHELTYCNKIVQDTADKIASATKLDYYTNALWSDDTCVFLDFNFGNSYMEFKGSLFHFAIVDSCNNCIKDIYSTMPTHFINQVVKSLLNAKNSQLR